MAKRSGKFYRKNESEVMKSLGFEPTPNSGSGWIAKEDGVSDECMCQLKSTDAKSIKVNLQDIHTLEYNSGVEHKIPVFAIQFLSTNEVFLLIKPDDIQDVSKYLKTGEGINTNLFNLNPPGELLEPLEGIPKKVITSSNSARKQLRDEMANKFNKKEKSAT